MPDPIPHTVIALDLATHTGIAGCTFSDKVPGPTWITRIDIPGCKWRGESFYRFNEALRSTLAAQVIGNVEVVYEQAHHRGGPPTRFALGLSAIVEMWAGQHGLPCYPVHTATLKQRTTGDGRADKAAMRAAAVAHGWIPQGYEVDRLTDDEIDALCLLRCWVRDGQDMLGARERRAQVRREQGSKKGGHA